MTNGQDVRTEGNPSVIVLAGPNGAGKSTAAPSLLKDLLDHLNREYGHEH